MQVYNVLFLLNFYKFSRKGLYRYMHCELDRLIELKLPVS